MKLLFVILAVLLVFATAERVIEAELVIKGILEGSFGAIGEEVVECIQDGALILEDMEHAIEDFVLAVENVDKAKLAEALQYVGDIISRLPEELKDCQGLEVIFEDLEKLAAEFLNPEALIIEIGEKMLWHGVSIFKDVRATISDFEADKFEDAGMKIGDIIKIVFLSTAGNTIDDVTVMVTEFYKFAFDLKLDLKDCESKTVTDVELFIADLEALIKVTSIEEFVEDVKKLVDDAEAIYHSAESCTEAWPVIKEGLVDLEPFYRNPTGIILAVTKAFALDPYSFPKDMYALYNALSSSPLDYKTIGDSSGDLIKMVLAHMPVSSFVKEQLKETS
jgi:hypothetical protein